MKLLRTSLVGLLFLAVVLPVRSADGDDKDAPKDKDDPAAKPAQPLFKIDPSVLRPDSPQGWQGFQFGTTTPFATFTTNPTYSDSTRPNYNTRPTGPYPSYGLDDAQTRMQTYMATQQAFAMYNSWKSSQSSRSNGIWLPGMGSSRGADACGPGAHLNMMYNPTFGGMANSGINIGQCFVVGTAVAESSGKLRPIEKIRVGERVAAETDPEQAPIDPAQWRRIILKAEKRDRSTAEIVLLRPVAWLEAQQARAGKTIELSLPGCGFDGTAKVEAVEECPMLASGKGGLVTGTIRHSTAAVIDVHVEGLSEPIGTTTNHRFWSSDRRQFVRADEVLPGERLMGNAGAVRFVRSEMRVNVAPVYNLEVRGSGTFQVSKLGVLVRDAGTGNPNLK